MAEEESELAGGGGSLDISTAKAEKLEVIHAFGLSKDLRNRVAMMEHDAIVYPVGKRLALKKNTRKNDLHFLSASKTQQVSAVAVDWGRMFLAVFFVVGTPDNQQRSLIHIYDVLNHRLPEKVQTVVYQPHEECSAVIEQATFLLDQDILVAQAGAPDFSVAAFEWRKPRKVFALPMAFGHGAAGRAARLRCHPADSRLFSVCGEQFLRMWRIQHDELKEEKGAKGIDRSQDFVDHIWWAQQQLSCQSFDCAAYSNMHQVL